MRQSITVALTVLVAMNAFTLTAPPDSWFLTKCVIGLVGVGAAAVAVFDHRSFAARWTRTTMNRMFVRRGRPDPPRMTPQQCLRINVEADAEVGTMRPGDVDAAYRD